jgi:hypothetical protein
VNTALHTAARELSRVLEPFVGCVYFAPNCHERYARLGFAPSPRVMNGVALPDGAAYFTSRGSLLGQVHGTLVASAFAVFNPAVVVPAVQQGWLLTDAPTIRAARQSATVSFLRDVVGVDPRAPQVAAALSQIAVGCRVEGRPLFAGALAGDAPQDDPLAQAWFFGDALREFRGDSHTAAWVGQGLNAVEIGLLTELWWGLPLKSYSRTRAWSDADLDEGVESLRSRGLVQVAPSGTTNTTDKGSGFTSAGRLLRAQIEAQTDEQMARSLEQAGVGLDDLSGLGVLSTLDEWSAAVRIAKGYPEAGPQELATLANRAEATR